ncbi:MAG: NifB/NifX family molybdenum-iron cluster-binding protein [Deltaproteobacteria bacterium]|nr:NifB/NifX family molybdenum-iron cluster-binding protein [Deltaproteobacteria bacterium]
MSSNSRVVAVACEEGTGLQSAVSGHFGHTPFFVVAEISDGQVGAARTVASPGHGEGGCSMPQFVQQLGVRAVVVGGLGARAAALLEAFGVEVIGGITGNAGEALRALAAGRLAGGDPRCSGHGGGGHSCGHHHHES